MNICECGCGQECKSKFVRGHNNRKKDENNIDEEFSMILPQESSETNNMINEEEPAFEYAENYTLTDVPQNVIINYEAGKKWLDKTFTNYSVRLLYNEEELPYEIVLSAYTFLDEEEKEKAYIIGYGNTFSMALKKILIKN